MYILFQTEEIRNGSWAEIVGRFGTVIVFAMTLPFVFSSEFLFAQLPLIEGTAARKPAGDDSI
jgi:hypothetical protein